MKVLKLCSYLFLYLSIAACSTTKQVNLTLPNNHYYAKNFSHHEFTRSTVNSIKKAATSDQALMLSLLNRPIPEDQKMMLAFASRQASYLADSAIMGIQIRGDKHQENRTRVSSVYAHVIEHDANAVIISAMSR